MRFEELSAPLDRVLISREEYGFADRSGIIQLVGGDDAFLGAAKGVAPGARRDQRAASPRPSL